MIEILERIVTAAKTGTDAELARRMGLSQQSIAKARTTKSVPASWLPKASTLFDVSLDWLYFGRGPMRPGEPPPTAPDSTPAPQAAPAPVVAQESACPACTELKKELQLERRERRELTTENRQMAAENRQLWKDNGELREKCARLEERQFQRSTERGDSEALGSSG